MKKAVALILAMLLLSGCGGRETPVETEGPTAGNVPAVVAETTEPQDGVWRAGVPFAGIAYEHYEAERFDEFTAPIYRLAEQGGNAADFDEADAALTDELYYVHTLMTPAGLRYYADPADA